MVIAVWLTLNVSADATGLLERPGPRPVDAGRGYRPVSRSLRRAARSVRCSPHRLAVRLAVARGPCEPNGPEWLLRPVTVNQCPVVTARERRTMSITSRR
jgi:hypothetical protein